MNDRLLRRRVLISALAGALGMALLARYSDRVVDRLGARPWALLGVVLACCGVSYAIGLMVAPSPRALKIRHLAAGAASAWLAYELSVGAARLGLPSDSDGFRMLWAPIAEETCKAVLLALVWAPGDERRDRREIVTAAVGIGVGFALRENFVYFGAAMGSVPVGLEWVLLRAIPPVLAHSLFGMILGGTVAHAVLEARVVGRPAPRFTVLGWAVAALVHVGYNGVALIVARIGGTYAVEWTALWSLVAIAAAVAVRRRVLTLAAADEPAVTTLLPPEDRSRFGLLAVACVWALFAAIPTAATRSFAIVIAPAVVAVAFAWTASLPLRPLRFVTPVVVGIALRPIVHAPELLVETLAVAWHGLATARRLTLEALAAIAWLAPVVAVAFAVTRTRGRNAAIAFGLALTAGLAGASLGGALATRTVPHLAEAMALATLATVPRTLALAAVSVRIGWKTPLRAALGVAAAVALSVAWDEATRMLRPRLLGSALFAAASLVVVAAVVFESVRRDRPVSARVEPAAEP